MTSSSSPYASAASSASASVQAAAAAAAAAAANNQYSFVRTCDGKFVRTAIPMHEFDVVSSGEAPSAAAAVSASDRAGYYRNSHVTLRYRVRVLYAEPPSQNPQFLFVMVKMLPESLPEAKLLTL